MIYSDYYEICYTVPEYKGIQIGEERGREKSKKAEKIEMAKAMIADNMDINTVAGVQA